MEHVAFLTLHEQQVENCVALMTVNVLSWIYGSLRGPR